MITIKIHDKDGFGYEEVQLKPTIFPDGTSQIWHLNPRSLLYNKFYEIIWNFESEREIIDLYSFKALLSHPNPIVHLHIPYLPYARQDKEISNDSTFNLTVFAQLINNLKFQIVSSVDVHNPVKATQLIHNFSNDSIGFILDKVMRRLSPDAIVFPDKGAQNRYIENSKGRVTIFFEKIRNQETGEIVALIPDSNAIFLKPNHRLLLVDDICDGGGTFVGVAKALREIEPNIYLTLFVTHGIFSKGRKLEGIDEIITTDSLIQNKDSEYKV